MIHKELCYIPRELPELSNLYTEIQGTHVAMDPKGVGYGERNEKLLKPKVLTCAFQVQRLDFMLQLGMLERAPQFGCFIG